MINLDKIYTVWHYKHVHNHKIGHNHSFKCALINSLPIFSGEWQSKLTMFALFMFSCSNLFIFHQIQLKQTNKQVNNQENEQTRT